MRQPLKNSGAFLNEATRLLILIVALQGRLGRQGGGWARTTEEAG